MKAQLDECIGRILLVDNIGDRAVSLCPTRFQCVGVWIFWTAVRERIFLTVCVFSSDLRKIRLASDLPERNCCASSGVPELLDI